MKTAREISSACLQRAGHEPISEEHIEERLKFWRDSWRESQQTLSEAADCIDRLQGELSDAYDKIESLSGELAEERQKTCLVGPLRRWLRKMQWTQ